MESTGLAIGALGLASLFNNVVDCFEYVQIGRSFGKSFQTSLLKLDIARLRLSRWGQAVGLVHLDDIQSLDGTKLSPQDIPGANKILGQIEELFADTEGISKRFMQHAPVDQSLALYDSTTDLEETAASLHKKMRDLAIRRQSKAGLRQKAKWALYEEKHLTRLIEDITTLVDSLVTMFPAAEAAQKILCDVEVSEMNVENSLPLLKGAAADQDKLLSDAISKAIGSPSSQSYNVSFAGNNWGFQLGYNAGIISGLR